MKDVSYKKMTKIGWLNSFNEKIKTLPFISARLSFLVILLFTIVYFVLVLLTINPIYTTDDDIAILADIKSGFLTNYMSRIFGMILSFFYINLSDSIPWYGLIYYISIGVSLLVLLRLLLVERSAKNLAIFVVIITFYTRFIQSAGYNSGAIITGGIATLGIFNAFNRDKVHWYTAIGYGLMFCLCFLWRIHCLPFIVVFLFPILIIKILAKKNRKYFISFALFILPCIILCVCEAFFFYYQVTPEQKNFDKFIRYGGIHGWDLYDLNKENHALLKDLGWTQNDFLLYYNWLYFDENKYTSEKAEQLVKHPELIKPTKFGLLNYVRYIVDSGKWIINRYRIMIFITLWLLSLIILYRGINRILLSSFLIVYTTIAAIILKAYMHYPDRWAIPMFFLIVCFLSYLLLGNGAVRSVNYFTRWGKMPLLIITLGMILITSINIKILVSCEKYYNRERQERYDVIERIKSMGSSSVFLPQPVFYNLLNYDNPLKEHKEEVFLIPTGWTNFSPRFYAAIQRIGLKHGYEIFPYFVSSNNSFVICNEDMVAPLSCFIKENYGIETRFRLVISLQDEWTDNVYKIERKIKGNTLN